MLNPDDDTIELPVLTAEISDEEFKTKYAALLEPTTRNRAEYLRWLCRGEGMTRSKLVAHGLICESLFGTETGNDAEALISSAYWTLVPSEFRDAIGNALAIDFDGSDEERGSLSDRREYYRKQRGISPRTVIRHEEKGAELLAKQIEIAPAAEGGQSLMRVLIDRMTDEEIKTLIVSTPRLAAIAEKFGRE